LDDFFLVAGRVDDQGFPGAFAADEVAELSKSSLDVTERVSKLLDELLPECNQTTDLISEIAVSSAEQSIGATQVNNAVQQLSVVTEQNAGSSEELASAAQSLLDLSNDLKESISFFTVDGKKRGSNIRKPLIKEAVKKGKSMITIKKKGENNKLPLISLQDVQANSEFESF
jgi:hypothetical protein